MKKKIFFSISLILIILIFSAGCAVWNSIKDRYVPYKMIGKKGGKTLVEFTFDSPSAETVHLAGAFNNWTAPGGTVAPGETKNLPIQMKKDKKTNYWKVVWAIDPGKYPYKYIINKTQWRQDPNSLEKVDDGFGGKNSIILVE